MRRFVILAITVLGGLLPLATRADDAARERQLTADVKRYSGLIAEDADEVGLYSRRGDAYFFLGKFSEAVTDYEKMVELDPRYEKSHWRRGIAYFYADKFKEAAHQFEIYDSFDNVDRENGIWRYFSQYKAYGPKKAREGLLKYEKDDREPFPSVYKLFSGDIAPDAIVEQIDQAEVSGDEKEKRYFYAHLYIGLDYAVKGDNKRARPHLEKAVKNTWGPAAGFGPSYMWHVGRIHLARLNATNKTK